MRLCARALPEPAPSRAAITTDVVKPMPEPTPSQAAHSPRQRRAGRIIGADNVRLDSTASLAAPEPKHNVGRSRHAKIFLSVTPHSRLREDHGIIQSAPFPRLQASLLPSKFDSACITPTRAHFPPLANAFPSVSRIDKPNARPIHSCVIQRLVASIFTQ